MRRAAEGTPAEDHAARMHDTAVNLLATTWFPGYDEPARKVGAEFRPFAVSALGGYGPDAMVAVSEMTHPGDELLLGEPGERWEASTTVFNTRLHRHHLIQAAAVAFWAATYDAVQAVANGERALACAPSNTAVDNLLERLIATGARAVRLGHPARVLEVVRSHTLDALVEQHDARPVIRDMLKEADHLERRSRRYTRARPAAGQKHQQRKDARELRRHARMLEQHAINQLLADAEVICATVSFDFRVLDESTFDLLVIDEACQSVEPGCWIPLRHVQRVVLAGDHCQLPPTILSGDAAQQGLDVSLMQRLVEHFGDTVTRQLTVQYRMHEQIMQFSSDYFYDGTLTADDSVKTHLLNDLPDVEIDGRDNQPVLFIDTAGAGWDEQLEPEGFSRLNPQEGQLVLDRVTALCEGGIAPRDIAVIAPYAAQVRWLRQHCQIDHLEIDTVDGFQGREKEAVVICTVRSNSDGEVGFLSDARRMNVALTRARRQLTVVGDSATLGADPFFAKLLEWFETSGAYRSVWELA